MARNSLIWGAAFSALIALTPRVSSAETDNFALPAGSMSWQYECKAGRQCPTKCTVQGADLFSTTNYVSLTITKMPDKAVWFQLDTGTVPINYIFFQAESVTCSIAGATLTSIRKDEAEKPRTSPQQ